MADDFLLSAAQQRLKVLQAARQRAIADLGEYETMGDEDSAGQEIQRIANLDAEATNLTNLAQRHAQSQQGPAAPRPDAWRGKRTDEMNYDDALAMIRDTSRYGKNLTHNDLQAGYSEVQRKRQAGEP